MIRARRSASRPTHALALLLAAVLVAACGGGGGDGEEGAAVQGAPATSAGTEGSDACGGDGGRAPQIRMGVTTLVQTFDPAQTGAAQAHYLTPVYDTVLRFDHEGEVVAGLAEEWEYDGVTATFTIRDDAVFADGTPIDASVVAANIERFVAVGGPLSINMAGLASVETPDERTVVLTFDVPNHALEVELAGPVGMIMNPAVFDAPDLDTGALGASGPYLLDQEATTQGDRYVYVPNPEFVDEERQRADRLEIVAIPDPAARVNALRSGEVEVIVVPPPDAAGLESAGMELVGERTWANYSVIFDREGTIVPALADPRVRQAMSMAVDRQLLVDGVFFGDGEPTAQPYLEGEYGHADDIDPAVTDYDPEGARALLAEAGYADGFSIVITSIPSTKSMAEAVVGFWNEIGIDATIEQLQPGTMGATWRTGDYALGITPTPLAEPGNFIDTWFTDQSAFHELFGIDDPEFIQLADAARAETDRDAREDLLADLSKHVVEEGYLIMLARSDQISAAADGFTCMTWQYGQNAPDPVLLRAG